MTYKLDKTTERVIETAVDLVSYAGKRFSQVQWSAEDASRSDLNFLAQIIEQVIDAGATVINLPDTVGYTTPKEYGEMFKFIKQTVPNIDRVRLSCHCHNDRSEERRVGKKQSYSDELRKSKNINNT